ncbi:MAG: O-antigen ligase family protein [Pseudomonadota bacterium]
MWNKKRIPTLVPLGTWFSRYFRDSVFGVILGIFVIVTYGLETRWIVYLSVLLAGTLFFLLNTRKEALLIAVFFLSFQVDVYVRPFFGRAGSAGIEIPMVVFTGFALLIWYLVIYGQRKINSFNWSGSLGIFIIFLLSTSFLSLTFTTEIFVGIARIIFELELVFIYWLSFNLVRSKNDLQKILKLLFIALAIQSFIYYIQSALGITFSLTGEVFQESEAIPRPGGTVSTNPAGFASFISPILLIGFSLYLAQRHEFKVRLLPVLVFLGSAAMVLTFTRAVWVGLVIGLIIIIIMSIRRKNYHRRRGLILISAMLIGALIFIPIMLNKRLSNQYQDEGALEERIRLMLVAVNVIEANPIVGIGPGAYSHVYKKYVSSELAQGWLYEVHNEFILRAAETGIPGGIAFLLLILAALRQAMKLSRSEDETIRIIAIGWFSSLVSLSWQMAWVPWRGFSYNAMLWLMLGLMDGVTMYIQQENSTNQVHPKE